MTQETLEEVAKRIYPSDGYFDEIYCDIGDYDRGKWIEGAKWQQEKIYNEIKELCDNENITGFSKLAYAKCLDIIKNK